MLISKFLGISWFDPIRVIVACRDMFTLTLTTILFTTMYERDIRIHTVVMSDGPGKVDYHKKCK